MNVTYQPASTIGSAVTLIAANTQGGTGYADFLTVTNSSNGVSLRNKTFRLNNTGFLEVIDSNYGNTILSLSN
jgi:hypothetical protein